MSQDSSKIKCHTCNDNGVVVGVDYENPISTEPVFKDTWPDGSAEHIAYFSVFCKPKLEVCPDCKKGITIK